MQGLQRRFGLTKENLQSHNLRIGAFVSQMLKTLSAQQSSRDILGAMVPSL